MNATHARPIPAARTRIAGLLLAAGLAMSSTLVLPRLALAQGGASAVGAPAAAPERSADAQVPIRRITLYRSGVGYFERSGAVDGNTQLQLRFNTDQINDILKSMILLDLDGGRIESVGYGSKEPLAKRLAAFGINIADNPGREEILQRLRGTPVRLTLPDGEVSGAVMNVESRPTVFHGTGAGSAAVVHNLPWINLATDQGIRSYNLTNVTGFEILDPALADELNKALATLAEYRADRSKTVDLRFSGAGQRRVVVGYVHETPVWKTSYRLVLPDADPAPEAKNTGQLAVQGWAIVENTTDQDWTDVRLALVSGRPVSFQMDLYEPLYTFRPTIPVPTIPGVMPRAYDAGVDLAFRQELQEAGQAVTSRRDARAARGVPPAPASAPAEKMGYVGRSLGMAGIEIQTDSALTADDMVNYAAQAQAQGAEVGEVFQYEVAAPVSIERQRSAMIPILAANITGRRVSIFNQSEGQPHPMRGVELVNETDLQLLPGPISVFDGAAYAGDAQIGHIARGDKRLLAYSVDLDVNVLTRPETTSTVRRLKIVDGMLVQTVSTTSAVSYAFDNKDARRARTIIVEQPRFDGWELVEPAKPIEETQGLYRFEVAVEAGRKASFNVVQERTEHQSMAVTSLDMPTVLAYHKDGKLSDAVLQAIRDVAARQSSINTVEREIAELDRQKNEIDAEQSRIRENMGRIDRASQLYTRYMTKLADQENTLENLREQRKAAAVRLETLRADLNNFLRTLNAE